MASERTKSTRSSARSTKPATASARSDRSFKAKSAPKTKSPAKGKPAQHSKGKTSARASSSKIVSKDDEDSEPSSSSSGEDDSGDAYGEEGTGDDDAEPLDEDVEEDEEADTDDMDDESDSDAKPSKRRKSSSSARTPPSKRSKQGLSGRKENGKGKSKSGANEKKRNKPEKSAAGGEYSDYTDEDNDSEISLEEGQAIAGRIYPAPQGGKVPAGQISRNSFKFLVNLQDPERNDRTWFQSHDAAFRLAEKEWLAFVEKLIPRLCEVDDELSPWPPKDLIHRIYRDVRFSSDKTPYKRNFSMSLSRSGRKGIWAGYFISVSPKGKFIVAAGVWGPGKNEIASIRHAIVTNPQQFRSVISADNFVKLFGPASEKGRGKGNRCNVFGHDDALKTAPKGVSKEHPDIDLLKLRSVAVVHTFEDKEVLQPDFMDNLINVVGVMVPFVHMINNCIALPPPDDASAPT